jgi:hypothetical protein
MGSQKPSSTVKDVREMARRFSNWGRWRKDDELGTVNFIPPEKVRAAVTAAVGSPIHPQAIK